MTTCLYVCSALAAKQGTEALNHGMKQWLSVSQYDRSVRTTTVLRYVVRCCLAHSALAQNCGTLGLPSSKPVRTVRWCRRRDAQQRTTIGTQTERLPWRTQVDE